MFLKLADARAKAGGARAATQTVRRTDIAGGDSKGRAQPSPGLVLATVAVVQFLVSVDLSIVNVALPQIGAHLAFSPVDLTWVINAYALTFGGLLLLGGKAADRYGRRLVLMGGLALFGLACMAGGLAHTPATLVAARAVQGAGAAALAPAALSLLTSTFPTGRARVRAFGVWSAVNASGGAFGVVAGGLLTQYAGWRWVMFVNVPLVVIALVLTARSVTSEHGVSGRNRSGRRPDVLGAVLVTGGMSLLVFTVVRTDLHPWTSAPTLRTLVAAVLLLWAFAVVEHTTTRDPLLRLGLLTNRSVVGANGFNLLLGAVMGSGFYFVVLYLQQVLGRGPAVTGVMSLPFAVGVVAGSMLAVKLGGRLAPRVLLIVGGLLTAAGYSGYALLSPYGSYAGDVLAPLIVSSVGYGLCLAPVVSIATASVEARETGAASALLNSSRQLGASLGLAVLGTVAYHSSGQRRTPEALTHGYAFGLTLDAGLLVAAVLIALVVLREPPRPAQGPEERSDLPEIAEPEGSNL
jgi:EmrB/QacA subfamily drug resistance transporter